MKPLTSDSGAAEMAIERRSLRQLPYRQLARWGTIVALVLMIVVFSLLKPDTFPTWSNAKTILLEGSLLGIVSAGLTVVLILGEFDLSIGYAATLGGVIAAQWLGHPLDVGMAIVVTVLVGVAVGLLNGFIVSYWRINAFIATLGSGAILYGIVLAFSGGQAVLINNSSFLSIGQGYTLGIARPVYVSALVFIVLWIVINRTEPGRRIDAIGSNTDASRLAGIRVRKYRILAFVVSALCATITGLILAAQIGGAYTDAGDSYLLQAFTVCFLGSVTLRDGEFHVLGTAVGVLIVSVAFDGLAQLGVSAAVQSMVQGGVLIVAVSAAAFSSPSGSGSAGGLVRQLLRRRPGNVPVQAAGSGPVIRGEE